MGLEQQVDTRSEVKSELTHTTVVYEKIRSQIMNGSLVPGARLKTRALADRFAVGLSPIREALSRLSTEGWVVQSDRRGFSVVPVSVEELWDLHNARCLLNEAGLRASIAEGDAAWAENVRLSCLRIACMQRPAATEDGPETETWNSLHRAFHASLVMGCTSARMVKMCNQLFDEIERYRRLGAARSPARSGVADEHQGIADAAVARDADLAVRLLLAHFTRTVEQVERVIRAPQD